MNIPFAKVDCSGNEKKYVSEVLDSGWLTTASKVQSLESKFCEFLSCRNALAVNSCTSGLHLALDALEVMQGDGVFVPSMTFTASAEVVRYMGADPVVLDVDYQSCSITCELLEEAIRKRPDVKVLIAVHYGGLALPMTGGDSHPGIVDICRRHGIRIVEDAAHALPSRWQGRLVGSFGDITCFSFYANKTMTTGEGGLVTTENDDLASRMKLMRLHGINRDVWDRFTSAKSSWEYDVVAPGYKYNMPDLNAAVGLAQFERLEHMHQGRVRCANQYLNSLASLNDQLDLPKQPNTIDDHSWHLFPIKIKRESKLNRDQVIAALNEAGISTSVHYKPIHRLEYYRKRYDLRVENYPGAERIWQSTLSLPIYNLLTSEEIARVCDVLNSLDW